MSNGVQQPYKWPTTNCTYRRWSVYGHQELRPVEEVTFVQLSAETYQHRDAIRFYNGSQVVLQTLAEGIPFEVLS